MFRQPVVDRLAFGILAESVRAFQSELPDDWTDVAISREFRDGLSSRELAMFSASAARSPSFVEMIRERMSSTQGLVRTLDCCGVMRNSIEEDAIQSRDAILAVLERANSIKDQRAFVVVYEPGELEDSDAA